MTTGITPRILIVDDEPGIRESLRMVLKNEYRCNVAANAREALESFQASPPDLVLLDILMPDMDGITLLEKFSGLDDDVIVQQSGSVNEFDDCREVNIRFTLVSESSRAQENN